MQSLLSCRISSDSKTVRISCFSRHRVSGDTWHDHVDATWNSRGVTHGMSHVVHLCERLTLSHVSNEEIMGKEINQEKLRKIVEVTCGMVEESGGKFPLL